MIATLRSTISTIALLCLTLALLFFAVRSCQQAAAEGTARVIDSTGRALGGVFGPRVSLNNSGVIEAPRDIAEFAVLEHGTSVVTRYRRARIFGWFASTIVVTGRYEAKLGIDLSQVRGWLNPYSRVLVLHLPPTRLLSLETLEVAETFRDCSWFTPLKPAEVLGVAESNRKQARVQVDSAELRRNADQRLEARLREVLAPLGVTLRVEREERAP